MNDFRFGTPQYDSHSGHAAAKFRCSSAAGGRESAATSGRVVLLVEDDWLLRQSLADELGAENWTVVEAESGETAAEILQSGLAINLLITDVRLGGPIDGWEVAEVARRRDDHIPVIYVSASPPSPDRRVPQSVFLSKPCTITELLDACRTLCPPQTH
jgi:CheY-like chemotaxis protein